jgi:hypothetical protein
LQSSNAAPSSAAESAAASVWRTMGAEHIRATLGAIEFSNAIG